MNLKQTKSALIFFILLGFWGILIVPLSAQDNSRDIETRLIDPGIESSKSKEPEYVPGEVLVKFKEGIDPQAALTQAGIKPEGIGRVHSIKPVIAKFKKDQKLEKDSDGWYWFLGKKYKEIENIPDETVFGEVYKNMPEVEKSLYRSYKITLPEQITVEEAISKFKSLPEVEYAEPNYIVKINAVPSDPYFSSRGSWGQDYDDLWGLKLIQADKAWDISQGEGVVVAVVDSGVDS